MRREFQPVHLVLVYNSRLHLFPGKFKSRWSGPYTIRKVLSSGAVEILSSSGGKITVNGQRLKHYIHGDAITIVDNEELEKEKEGVQIAPITNQL
jgi:hypothetical protein